MGVQLPGILDGFILLQRQGFNRVVSQSDSLQTVLVIKDNTSVDLSSTLLRWIQRILMQGGQWILKHIPREINKIAYCLAKMTSEGETGMQVFDNPPGDILEILSSDKTNGTFA
ncbi:hypothetical protein PVK06_010766 [Gossypium arboreum]|uniref:RNase H type-1 domain-containing protein n=1 Tax=Gossypium arboreum TaxID=29729 RepID=A0ABR0Q780_GOSAR|nr:hypothetical protein PVK06_010766 [Gossypium arboreum]